jgi:hypothetical protein
MFERLAGPLSGEMVLKAFLNIIKTNRKNCNDKVKEFILSVTTLVIFPYV